MSIPVLRTLSALEARVLGVLSEKAATVPDTYPLSLNALVAGCNQKTAREPTMELRDDEVLATIDALKALSLVFEVGGARVIKYEHNLGRVLAAPGAAVALLAVLMLRGPQTVAELRQNSERLHRFADLSSVEGFLDEQAIKGRVVKLAKAPGEREARWAHLLCGEPVLPVAMRGVPGSGGSDTVALSELAAIKAEQARLAAEVAVLKALVLRLAGELGVAADETTPASN
jgi:uncharacterized protein YceH (UPF0502 family)